MPPRSTKGKPPTRYEGMPPPPPPKPAPKPSAATTRPEDVSLPVPHPKQVRKRRSNTNVSELERRTHKEAEEAEDPLQAIATRVLKLNPPTPKKLFLSAPAIPATPGHQTPSRVHLRPPIPPPRRDAVTPSPREPPNTHQEPQRQDQLPNPTDPAKRPTIDTQDSTKDAHMIPDSFRQDPWWSDGTQTTTEAVDKFRKALRRTSTTRETIQIDDDDKSNDGLQYLPSQLNYNDEKLFPSSQRSQPTPAEDTAEKNKKAATLQPKATKTTYQQPESQQHQQPELHVPSSQPPPSQEPPPSQQPPKASLPPSSGGTSKKGQKAAAPQPKHTKKKPEKSESEQEEEEIKFVSRVWWGGNEKTPIYENTQTRLMEDFDIRTRFKEMDRWVKHHHAGPKGLNAFLTSATATPANQKLPKAQQHPVILEKDGLERTWRTEVVKTIDKFKNRTIWVNLDFKYSPNTTGVNPAPSSSSKEKSKKKSLGTPTEQLGEKEKAFSQAQGRVKQQADEFARILHCEDAVCPHKNMPCWNDNGTHVRLTGRDLLVWANHYVHCDGVFDHRNPPPGLASKLRENAHKSSKQLKKELAASASLQPWQPVQVIHASVTLDPIY